MSIAAAFPLDVHDACGNFFGTALRAFDPPIDPAGSCLEIGCAEFNWLKYACKAWPQMTLTGIDWRASKPVGDHAQRLQGDVMDVSRFPEASFDWCVSISAIEHVGLGHYDKDPVDEWGDRKAVVNAYRWLKPGGWFYFDVPYRPGENEYQVCGTSHRVYDDDALIMRLQVEWCFDVRWRGVVSTKDTTKLIAHPPALPEKGHFYYIGFWVQKRAWT